jgi:hypothetical protein
MDERVVRSVVLVQAIESCDVEHQILSDDDRSYASRSANELAQWAAADRKVALSQELFLEKRAGQILQKIVERDSGLARFVNGNSRFAAIAWMLPLLALLSGALLDRIGDTHRVDLLSGPLLLIMGWNVLVYLLVLALAIFPRLGQRGVAGFQRIAVFALSASSKLPRTTPAPLAAALGKFSAEWLVLSAPLLRARASRILHLSAAAFALGVIASLYVRGMLSQYVTGWESTFLNAAQVHALLSFVFLPALSLFPLPGFSLAQVQALQLPQTLVSSDGALWVHLYAASLLLIVIVPRLVLALLVRWQENRLSGNFSMNLAQPYFQKLTANIGPAVERVLRVFPYGFTLDEGRDRNLTKVAKMLLGESARVMLRPSTPYGEELHDALKGAGIDKSGAVLSAMLFNLTATPEKENHGAFLHYFGSADGSNKAGVVVLLDESAYLARVGGQPGGELRMRERIELWRQFCQAHHASCMVVNLFDPQARADEIAHGWPDASSVAA